MTPREEVLLELNQKVARLIEAYTDTSRRLQKLEERHALLQEQNALLKSQLEGIRSARALSLSAGDVEQTRKRLTAMIKEIDRCIALINV